jgi:hypothetical protein
MATQPVITENQNQPEVDQATGKFIHIYQPRDAEGQFIGKPYRFLYTDHMDLVQQIEQAKEQADRTIHEIKTGKRKIVGEAAVKNPDWTPAPEPTEEAEKKRREDFRKAAEQELGAPLDSVRQNLKKAQMLDEYLIAQNWAMNNPDYYACKENAQKLAAWMKEKNYAFTAANFDLAFEELKDSLKQPPQEQQLPADSTQQPAAQPTKAEVKPQSTGIIPGQFAGTRQPNNTEKRPLTAERFRQISKMSYPDFTKLKRINPNEYWAFVKMKEEKAQPQQ